MSGLLVLDEKEIEGGTLDERRRWLQRHSFDYFVNEVNRDNGLVLDKTAPNWPSSIAAVGMALAVHPVGVEQGFIEREDSVERVLTTLRTLVRAPQSDAVDASGYKGFFYHWLDMQTAKRAWTCELSSIDTALLVAGALVARSYFGAETAREAEIRELAETLYERIDWPWMLAGDRTFCHGWRPETGFLPYHWHGYDEALILYLLALGSPTHPVHADSYGAWCKSYEWKKVYDQELLYAGPLFIHQMSHIWCDFRGIRDRFMREHDSDYFENSRRATYMQQRYAIENPLGYAHVGELCWGITASDGPGPMTKKVDGIERTFYDYVARGAPYGPDDGTIAPWAVVASLPFAPEIVRPTLHNLAQLHVDVPNPYGFKASFNPAFHDGSSDGVGWVSPYHFGVNEGPTVLMSENSRTGMIWDLMKQCGFLSAGLRAAGFEGGWLDG